MKRIIPILFFLLSTLFAIFSMPFSGALKTGYIERIATATIASDNKGILELKGFDNNCYDMNNKYKEFGTITNNTMEKMNITIAVTPHFTEVNRVSTLKIKIGTDKNVYHLLPNSTEQFSIYLNPNQTVSVFAFLVNNATGIDTAFQFTATNDEGTYSMVLGDSTISQRNVIFY